MNQERIFTGEIPLFDDPRQAGEESRVRPAPLFLLADSQLLFWQDEAGRFVDRIAAYTGPGAPRCAYLGASNGDQPEFYSIFLAAIEAIGPAECRLVPATPSEEEREFVESADVILLAGGDVDLGWRAFEATGIRTIIERRYWDGAVIVGVSAGAVQLGTAGWPEEDPDNPFATFGFAPFVVDAHAEADEWANLRTVIRARSEGARGIGIPSGGGLLYHADGTLEAVRHTLAEFTLRDGTVTSAVIFPPKRTRRNRHRGRAGAAQEEHHADGAELRREDAEEPIPRVLFSLLQVPRPGGWRSDPGFPAIDPKQSSLPPRAKAIS